MIYKIGLFLAARPFDGGAFQYSQSMLEALAALKSKEFEVVVGYTHDLWLEKILQKGLMPLKLSYNLWGRTGGRRISGMLPMNLWRKFSPFFHPMVRKIIRQKCNLWVFPAQDSWMYLIPVRSIGVIYDLMHRYEGQFAEVSARRQFEIRENHYRNMCRWSQGILVDSKVGKKHVLECYPINPAKIHVLPFTAPSYIHNNITAKIANKYLKLPEKYFFYPAQFWKHKNHQSLLYAIAALKSEINDLKFIFVGSQKNGYESTIALAKKLNLMKNILILGYIPDSDMSELYQRARALIMPTFFGPTNIPPLEAIAAGCPVAVSDIYGMREQLGDAALYFNPASISEIKNIMRLLWTDDFLCKKLSQKGLVQSSNWDQTNFNKKFEHIIKYVLNVQQIPIKAIQ
jgi:glycosyltransferase involved in cell wall biosynthesis